MGLPSAATARMTQTVAIAGSAPLPPPAVSTVPASGDQPPALANPSIASQLHRKAPATGDEHRYEIGSLLGAGANGRIYAVRDRDLDRSIAVKYLSHQDVGSDDVLESFLNEARITASLQHPNVLPVHEIAVDQRGQVYFTMKRIEGRSLADAIDASTSEARDELISSSSRIVSIAINVCSALAYAHHHRIVHQDVKPSNIMLGKFGEVLLIDWGSAMALDKPGAAKHLYGTPLYMSPEQAQRSHADERSDVYCMGATLFHALTLRYPTMCWDEDELWKLKREGRIDPPTPDERAQTPPALLAIALKALAPSPEARYADASAMLADLQAYQAGMAVSARSDTLLERFRRWYRANARVFWIACSSAAAIAAISAAFLVEKSKEHAAWHVVYDEDFTHATPASLAATWMGLNGNPGDDGFHEIPLTSKRFSIQDGCVHLIGELGYTELSYRADLFGDVRVEWDYSQPKGNQNLNCFIGGHDRWTGYTFHVGSWLNPAYVALTTGPQYPILDCDYLAHPLETGRVYRFTMEKEGSRLRLRMDGNTIFDDENPAMAYGDASSAFGFDCVDGSDLVVTHVRVSHKPIPQKISPLAVADKLLQIHDYPRAGSQYLDIMTSYPGTELAQTAGFRMAVCAIRSGDEANGVKQLEAFVAAHPDDTLAPYALYELLDASRRHHDDARSARLREALVRWREHPILQRVIAQLAEDHLPELATAKVAKVSDQLYRPDIVERIHATLDELHLWGDRYGTAWWKNSYVFSSPDVLHYLGHHRDVADRYPPQSTTVGIAFLRMGLYGELLARFPHDPFLRGAALADQGREDEDEGSWMHWQILLDSGRYAEALADPRVRTYMRARALLLAGKYEEVAADYRYSSWDCADALVALGRPEEIGAIDPSDSTQARMLLETGRLDEVVAKYPGEYDALYRVVLHYVMQGETAKARTLLDDLAIAQVPAGGDYLMFQRDVFPYALRMISGETGDGPGAFAETLAHRYQSRQRMWHLAAFIAGTIDEAAFNAQPYRYLAKERLVFAQALRADCHRNGSEALARYREYAASPCFPSYPVLFEREFVRWRIDVLSKP